MLTDANVPYDRLKALIGQMTKTTNEFRKLLSEVKEVHSRQIERVQRERDAALMAARVHTDVDESNVHGMAGVEIATTKKVRSH